MVAAMEVRGIFIEWDYKGREISRGDFNGKIYLDDNNHLFKGYLKDSFGKSQVMGHMTKENEIGFLKYYKPAHYFFYIAKKDGEYSGDELKYKGAWRDDGFDDPGTGIFEMYLKEIEEESEYENVVFDPIQEKKPGFPITMKFFYGKHSPEQMEEFIKSIYIR